MMTLSNQELVPQYIIYKVIINEQIRIDPYVFTYFVQYAIQFT